ncbi:dicarboxylate/amino acid:cation symporter [Candidatus Gracilibacteria bacterium]|nr:dicarboxylate/amino acid:cation symporter [Candidatus Gracilibacteria bacterium]MCF7819069.1 dicarboxylate/amino acid:cation symporter [Candidatus Gracilibacteria bacterium]
MHLLPHFQNVKDLTHTLHRLTRHKLWLQILIGMVVGLGIGILFSPNVDLVSRETAEIIGSWISLPGHFFLTLVQMIIVPLVVASVIRGIGDSGSLEQIQKMGWRLVLYFLMTTTIAIIIGVSLATWINPGAHIDQSMVAQNADIHLEEIGPAQSIDWKTIPTSMINILPANPIGAIVNKEMLQIVLFSIIVGLALISLPDGTSKPFIRWIGAIQAVCLKIVNWAMHIAPLAVMGLLAQITIKTGVDAMLGMSFYMGTVLLGLMCLLGVYLLIVWIVGKRNPWKFLSALREVQLLAFSTSSSAAVMPLSIKTAEEKLKVHESTAQFLIPLGTTINMDGTALYQGVATVFLAQVFGISLGMPELIMVVLTAVGASIGTPATPGVGIIILSAVLSSAGVPPSGVALIIGVDRILDMCRTTLNVTGDLTASVVIDRFTHRSLVQKIAHPFSS